LPLPRASSLYARLLGPVADLTVSKGVYSLVELLADPSFSPLLCIVATRPIQNLAPPFSRHFLTCSAFVSISATFRVRTFASLVARLPSISLFQGKSLFLISTRHSLLIVISPAPFKTHIGSISNMDRTRVDLSSRVMRPQRTYVALTRFPSPLPL
jgi:hypothetical protein